MGRLPNHSQLFGVIMVWFSGLGLGKEVFATDVALKLLEKYGQEATRVPTSPAEHGPLSLMQSQGDYKHIDTTVCPTLHYGRLTWKGKFMDLEIK